MIESAAMFMVRANDRMCSDVYGAREQWNVQGCLWCVRIECAAMLMVRENDRMCSDVCGARE